MLEMINQPISIHWETASIYVQLAINCKKTMGEWGGVGGAKKKKLHLNSDVLFILKNVFFV